LAQTGVGASANGLRHRRNADQGEAVQTVSANRGGGSMNLGASMLAKRVHQDENEEPSFVRGFLIGIPCAIALWMAIIWLWSAVVG